MIALAAFLCLSPIAHDGDTIRCANEPQAIRLVAIDAPEIGRCRGRPGRVCVAGDGIASRDFLQRGLDLGPVLVIPHKADPYGRLVATVMLADGSNASCALMASGNAAPRPQWDHRRLTQTACPTAFMIGPPIS
jgi:micrococcal nuclease